jgi:Mn2+/Fe2+ NRAMP family transporter
LVTGAADDDPSGIATYSEAGAKSGYELGWTVVLTNPSMVAVQVISARLGASPGAAWPTISGRTSPRRCCTRW